MDQEPLLSDRPSISGVSPIDFKLIENRLRSFNGQWPSDSPVTPTALASAGFYYFNVGDQVRCAWCGGIIGQWEANDHPHLEHRKFFPDCPIVRQSDSQMENIGIQSVGLPKSPEYSTLESRIRSFSSWDMTIQDPTVLAQAGFFYLGSADEVRCFSCDGGLRNWLETDDAWFEHTRWFPKCEYVMLAKGPNYVKSVIDRTAGSTSNNQPNNQSISPPTMSVDDAMNTQAALEALAMGLNAGRVRAIVQRKIEATGRTFNSTEALVSAVLDGQLADEGFESFEAERRLENQVSQLLLSAVTSVGLSNEEAPAQPTSSHFASIGSAVPDNNSTYTEIDPSTLPESGGTQSVQQRSVECKICMAEEVGVVFLPCGHLLSCTLCAPALATCPLCRSQIKGRVRTFLS